MRMAPLPEIPGEPIGSDYNVPHIARAKANSALVRDLKNEIDNVEELVDDESREELAATIEELRKKMDKLETNISSQPQRLPGQLVRFGSVVLGWEDIILLLVLIVIFVSWIRGSMTTQDTLVTLMGAGAGGAWGIATGRGFSPPS